MRPNGAATDWRDAIAYALLLDADRSIHAWEWLRRDRAYRVAALAAMAALAAEPCRVPARPQDWGLEAFEDPDLQAPRARPLWSRDIHPLVLRAVATGVETPADAFDLEGLAKLATLLQRESGTEHLLLSDGLRAIRLDVLAGSLAQGPVQLRYLLGGVASAEPPLLTLRRLLVLCRTGTFGRSLHRPEVKARRWVMMLRAWDALAAGADQREIAAALLSASAAERRWRTEAPSLRSQAQRLVRGARRMGKGGYLNLLR